jgi:hypothetical protein
VAENKQWLADPNPNWEEGLDMAERSANLLEAAQLIAMHDPPTRTLGLMRAARESGFVFGPGLTQILSAV